MKELQKDIGEWQNRTFKQATLQSVFNHLKKEMKEVQEVINRYKELETQFDDCFWEEDAEDARDQLKNELADVIILVVALADLGIIDLEQAVKDKMVINKARKWGKPDSQGVVEHIKE